MLNGCLAFQLPLALDKKGFGLVAKVTKLHINLNLTICGRVFFGVSRGHVTTTTLKRHRT